MILAPGTTVGTPGWWKRSGQRGRGRIGIAKARYRWIAGFLPIRKFLFAEFAPRVVLKKTVDDASLALPDEKPPEVAGLMLECIRALP